MKNIDAKIPKSKFSVTSSLALDTLHAEGYRRYMDSLSTRVGRFIDQMEK